MITPVERVLNYVPEDDPRNANYPIAPLLSSSSAWRIIGRRWGTGPILDQGYEGACVGFGWTSELSATPQKVQFVNADGFARKVYNEAKKGDPWPGENYEGTSVLAGAKVVQSLGLMKEYRWAFSIQEIIDTVRQFGPVVVGIPWYDAMYETRPSGLVETGGYMVGGHCLTLTGYHPRRYIKGEGFKLFETFEWVNSWGLSYGKRGKGFIQVDDFAALFSDFGEACVPVGRFLPDLPVAF